MQVKQLIKKLLNEPPDKEVSIRYTYERDPHLYTSESPLYEVRKRKNEIVLVGSEDMFRR